MKAYYFLNDKGGVERQLLCRVLTKPRPFKVAVKIQNDDSPDVYAVKLEPKVWNQAKQQVRNVKGVDPLLLNSLIDQHREKVNTCIQQAMKDGNDVYTALTELFKPTPMQAADTPLAMLDQFVKEATENSDRKTATLKNYRSTLGWLERFEREVRPLTDWRQFTPRFRKDFENFLTNPKNNLADRTATKYVSTLKSLIVHLIELELIDSTVNLGRISIRNQSTKGKNENAVSIDYGELTALRSLTDLTDRQQFAVDIFTVMCLTGLRISDAESLKSPSDFQSELKHGSTEIGVFYNEKTGKYVPSLLLQQTREILERYDWRMDKYHRNTVNKDIKKLAQRAGIDGTKHQRIQRGGKLEKQSEKQKYELVTCHTARRSFATIAAELGIPKDVISKFLGHTTAAMTDRYILTEDKAGLLELAEKFSELSAK